MTVGPLPPSDSGARARLAVAWTTGFQFFRDLVQFGLTMALVRLLPPDAYGQFGFVTTLLSFFTLYSFREFLSHTLQAREGEPVHYQDHFTAGAVVQASLFVVVNAIELGLRWLPHNAAERTVLHVMSVLFVLDLPSELRVKMLERELAWRRLRTLQAMGFVGGGVASIALAFAGAGAYALLLPTLVMPLPFMYDLFVVERWRPTWAFSWDRFRPSWNFGWTRIATVSFVAAATLIESAWLTGAIGFALFGLFNRATGLAQLVCGRVAGLLSTSVYPVLTRLPAESDSFRRASAMYLRSIGWTVVPLATVTSILAGPIVNAIYGRKWIDAIPLVPFAVASVAIAALVQTAYTLLLANGRQRDCLVADMWRLGGTLLTLVIALPLGLRSYLAGGALMHVISLAMVLAFLVRARAVDAAAVFMAIGPALVSASPAVALALVTPGGAIAQAAVFGVVYLIALRVLFAAPFAELVRYLPLSHQLNRWLRFTPALA